jgi:hypothetical protein
MSSENISPELQSVLVHDILPGQRQLLRAYASLSLKKADPEGFRLGEMPGGKILSVDDILPANYDRALITMPGSSPAIRPFHNDCDPLAELRALTGRLRDECSLVPGEDYMLMSVFDKVAKGSELSIGTPSRFLLSINQEHFHDIAMDTLRKIADPRAGAELVCEGNSEKYRAQLAMDQSQASQLVRHIIANTLPSEKELDELRMLAARKGNFEFCERLMECGDLLYPGFAAARSKARRDPSANFGRG